MSIVMLGIDLGKNSCSLAGLNQQGAVVLRRRMRRESIIALTAKLDTSIYRLWDEVEVSWAAAWRGMPHLGLRVRVLEPQVCPCAQAGAALSSQTSRFILNTRLASPIFTRARAMPMVRTNSPIRLFCSAKTCSMRERTPDLRALARRVRSAMGRPVGFLR